MYINLISSATQFHRVPLGTWVDLIGSVLAPAIALPDNVVALRYLSLARGVWFDSEDVYQVGGRNICFK